MVFTGADSGHVMGHGGRVRFERSLPVGPLGQAGALLVYAMNSEELPARLTRPGTVSLQARATDQAGRTQPGQPQWNPLGYANNTIHETRLAVAPASPGIRPPSHAGATS